MFLKLPSIPPSPVGFALMAVVGAGGGVAAPLVHPCPREKRVQHDACPVWAQLDCGA